MKLLSVLRHHWVRTWLRPLIADEGGFIVSAELVTVVTMAVIGLIAGISAMQSSVVEEFNDLGGAFTALNQSYSTTGYNSFGNASSSNGGGASASAAGGSSGGGGVKIKAQTFSSSFVDSRSGSGLNSNAILAGASGVGASFSSSTSLSYGAAGFAAGANAQAAGAQAQAAAAPAANAAVAQAQATSCDSLVIYELPGLISGFAPGSICVGSDGNLQGNSILFQGGVYQGGVVSGGLISGLNTQNIPVGTCRAVLICRPGPGVAPNQNPNLNPTPNPNPNLNQNPNLPPATPPGHGGATPPNQNPNLPTPTAAPGGVRIEIRKRP